MQLYGTYINNQRLDFNLSFEDTSDTHLYV